MISIEGFDMACSYREYYDELGLIKEKNVTVGRMLEVAQEAQGEIFEGYKGGEYQIKWYSDCYLVEDESDGYGIEVSEYFFKYNLLVNKLMQENKL